MAIANNSKYRKEVFDAVCRKGKKCGEVCIPKRSKCRDGQQKLSQPESSKSNNFGRTALITAAATGGGTALVSAGTLGAIAGIQKVKQDYIKGFTESGKIALKESEKIEAPRLPSNIKTAVFAVGGFGTKDAFSESVKLEENIKSLGVKNLYSEPIKYGDFNVVNNPAKDGAAKAMSEGLGLFIKTVIQKKHNPVARQLAAKLLAYKKANPDVDFQLIGHSGGGLTVQETNEILHTLGVKAKTTAIGSPDVGIIPGNGDVATAASDKDYIVNAAGGGKAVNRKSFNKVAEHGQDAYFEDPDFRKFVKDRLVTPVRQDRMDKANCKVGKECGDICIPKKSVCRENNPQSSKSLKINEVNIGVGIAKAGMALGAATIGVPLTTYAVQKVRFQTGFSKSAELAKEQAKNYPVPDDLKAGYRSVKDQSNADGAEVESRHTQNKVNQITFFTGGVGGVKGLEADYMGQQIGRMLPDHHVVGIESPEQEIVAEKGETVLSPSFLKKATRALLKDNLVKGRSDVAVRIAARAYAYHQKFPDKPINLMGQSGGGMPTREAYEILDKLGVKDVRVTTTGSPYFGLTRPTGLSLIDPDVDPVEKMYGITMPNKANVKANGHSLYYSNVHYKMTKNNQWTGEKDNNVWDGVEVNKSTQDVLNKYFDRTKKDSASDSYTEGKDLILKKSLSGVGRLDAANSSKDLLVKQFSVLLSRACNKQIGKIVNIKSSLNGEITGLFTLENKPFRFTFKDGNLTYQSTAKRSDSIYIYYDAVPKKGILKGKRKRCKVGISCGSTCIEKDNVCKLKTSELAKPSELVQLNQAIARFKLEENIQQIKPEAKKEEDYLINPETGGNYTIRELRKVAASKGVVGYGSMPIDEMRAAIKLMDKDPESARRIVSGVARKRSLGTRAIAVSGLSGRNKNQREAKQKLKDVVVNTKRLEALIKFAGSAPIAWTAGAVGAFLLGTSIRTYEQTKGKYREGFDESAKLAEERAVKLSLTHIPQDNITFAVGSGKGHGAEEIKELLQKKGSDLSDGDRWLAKNNYVIPFNLQETGINKKSNETGGGDEILDGMKNYLQTFKRGSNQDAIDLAANLYAYGIQRKISNPTELKNKYKKINVVAHGMGGQTAKEALELLSRMDIKGSPTGKEVLKQVNVVNLGTPHFGFAENLSRRHRTIISPQDPVSSIPNIGSGARQQWISSVKGHSAKDYLEDERVRNAIRESFGYYEGGLDELTRRGKKRAASKRRDAYEIQRESSLKDIISGDQSLDSDVKLDFLGGCSGGNKRCGDICLPPEKKCRLNYSSNPQEYNKRRLLAKSGKGSIARTSRNLGQNAERTLLKANNLVDGIVNRNKTARQKIEKAVVNTVAPLAIDLGLGPISQKLKEEPIEKRLKGVDKALVKLQEEKDIASNQLKEKLGSNQEKIRNFVQSRLKKKQLENK
jgi:hypothetical protein